MGDNTILDVIPSAPKIHFYLRHKGWRMWCIKACFPKDKISLSPIYFNNPTEDEIGRRSSRCLLFKDSPHGRACIIEELARYYGKTTIHIKKEIKDFIESIRNGEIDAKPKIPND